MIYIEEKKRRPLGVFDLSILTNAIAGGAQTNPSEGTVGSPGLLAQFQATEAQQANMRSALIWGGAALAGIGIYFAFFRKS